MGISRHGITITSVDRTDPFDDNGNRDKKVWELQITYIVYDTACITDATDDDSATTTDDDDTTFGPDDTVDDDGIAPEPLPTSSKKSSKSSKSSSSKNSKVNKDRFLASKSSSKSSKSIKTQPLPDSCALKASVIQKQLSDKQNQKAINLAMEDADIGKGTTYPLNATTACTIPSQYRR